MKQLPALLDKYNEQEKKKQLLEKESDKYINEFLLNPNEQYFYIPATDIFVKYDSKSYTYITEDDFWYIILNDITNHNDEKTNLNDYKQKTKNIIVDEVKKKSILKTIPESTKTRMISLYKLIWNNTIESLMAPSIYKQLVIKISAPQNSYYKHSVEENIFPGFKAVLGIEDDKYYKFLSLLNNGPIDYKKIASKQIQMLE